MSKPKNSKLEVVGNTATVWRPKTWSEVIGQKQNVNALTGMLKSGKLKQSFILEGEHGCGKTTSARLFAASVNCANLKSGQYEPCGECDSCKLLLQDPPKHPDYLEIDAASNGGIANIRSLQEFINFKPRHNLRVVCIDEAHELTGPAQEAVLKMFEKPPAHVLVFLATTNVSDLKPTVISRGYKLTFNQPSSEENVKLMRRVCKHEQVRIDPEALEVIAESCGQHTRDCLNTLSYIIDQSKVDDKYLAKINKAPVEVMSKMVDKPTWMLVGDFCIALLNGKTYNMLLSMKSAKNKTEFVKMVLGVLTAVLYGAVSEDLLPEDRTRGSVILILKRTKMDMQRTEYLAKLCSELANIMQRVASYSVPAEPATLGLFIKYASGFKP